MTRPAVVFIEWIIKQNVPLLIALIMLVVFLAAFYHERALLLGRVGRHEEALAIYIHILKDPKLAEE